jgi:membrane fusion protein, multidrug efflux system
MIKTEFLSVIVFSFLLISCSNGNKEEKKTEDTKNAFKLQKKEVTKTINLPAELIAYEHAEINARTNGYVQKVNVDIGDIVKKGQVLAILEAPELASQSAQAEAKYYEAAARRSVSLDRFHRISKAAGEQGVVSELEFISAKNQMIADSAAMLSAQSTAKTYKQLQAYLTILSPFNGVVTSRLVDIGDLVGNSGKSTLMVIERPDILQLMVYVPESFVNNLPQGDSLAFSVDAFQDRVFKAKLARKSGSIDPDTHTELWEYEYHNDKNLLKPGMYSNTQLKLNRREASFVVPVSAIVTSLEKKFVVRINNGQAEWIDVRDGIALDKEIEVFGNLQEGDVLLTRGTEEIKPGTSVKTKLPDKQ